MDISKANKSSGVQSSGLNDSDRIQGMYDFKAAKTANLTDYIQNSLSERTEIELLYSEHDKHLMH